MSTSTLITITHGIIALSIIASVTVLLALGDLSEATAIALYGVSVTLVGGAATALTALKVPPAPPQA